MDNSIEAQRQYDKSQPTRLNGRLDKKFDKFSGLLTLRPNIIEKNPESKIDDLEKKMDHKFNELKELILNKFP